MDAGGQYALAYALTATAGIRALLPLVLLSLAVHIGYVHPPSGFAWLGGMNVTIILAAVALVEMLADKVPLLDHALHVAQIVAKPAAADILVGGTTHVQNHDVLVGLMILGALNALGVHSFTSSLRVASTATTAGVANPFISVIEDVFVVAGSILAFLVPYVAAAVCALATIILARAGYRLYRKGRGAGMASP